MFLKISQIYFLLFSNILHQRLMGVVFRKVTSLIGDFP
jgi:hypothetical protein